MFARQDITTGGMILGERPGVIVPYLVGLPIPLSELYSKLFNRLPPTTFHDLMSLSNCKGQDDNNFLEGIIRANAIGIRLDVPDVPHPELSTHRAIFLNTSRCNHSCGPNAKWEWDVGSFCLILTAVRPIVSGEEITIHYTSVTRSRYERRDTLQSLYGFSCRCDYCSLPSTEAFSRSDEARAELENFWATLPTFEQWCLDASMPDTALIDRHVRALQLIEQEGMHILNSEKHADAIAMCYGALEDVEMFRAWTGRARGVKLRTSTSELIVLAKWLSNPLVFPAWGWRKTFCGARAGG
ncbi:hypothetical protein BDZ94DRAFT_1250418 [Collybia nuda]|uniref:SET domain-containing protein n=1 Tax=Collybia nuda TaxID=64659 RepID=A0A9P5YFF7_9AGAR|nr:hypothetical protein BDZ94DRAFT_1250418 [Collybia nuda]